MYEPSYSASRALIVGINKYQNVNPLNYARQDAESVAEILVRKYGFEAANLTLLLDEEATKQRIIMSFLSYISGKVGSNDRIFIFFAGHGHTLLGRRGEVGFLVPVDGSVEDHSTLIRWDELTRNADLIHAKHILFIMDACYGGLAVTRTLGSGSVRFLKDMLQRYGRQVLTAGKANEVVSDSGGPIPGHSVFTGHMLQGLDGLAANKDGIITANSLMAYVYDRVAKDMHSHQTPHYGFIDGDGDFIFAAPALEALRKQIETDSDMLVEQSFGDVNMIATADSASVSDIIKEYLSDFKFRIKLDDLVVGEIRRVLNDTSELSFPVQGTAIADDALLERMKRYENILMQLQTIGALLSYWGTKEHTPSLKKIISRLSDGHESLNGLVVWLALRWYPSLLVAYSSGISAIASENYENLAAILLAPSRPSRTGEETKSTTINIVEAMLELDRADVFKRIPGHERHYVPRSEYLFKALQPLLEDVLFLGKGYEAAFDRFEMIYGLAYVDLTGSDWGPLGRFTWKQKRGYSDKPFTLLQQEVDKYREQWLPLKAGLFGGSLNRATNAINIYTNLLGRVNWF